MDLCCEHKTCDLAYVMSNRCYLVECFSVDMCGIIPKGVNMMSPLIGMVKRPDSPKILELSDFVAITSTTPRPRIKLGYGKCKFGDVVSHTTFVGGLKAGNFSNKGQVTNMETCQEICCKRDRCDVAVMMKRTCFSVACRSMELCKPRKAKLEHFSLILSYRDRNTEEDEQVIELLRATKPPATIATTTTTKKTTTRKTTIKTPIVTTTNNILFTGGTIASQINSSIIIPEPLKPNKNVLSWCLPSFIVEGVKLRGGLNSGPYHVLGKVDSMEICMRKCCALTDCTTAYYNSSACYAIRCLDKRKCKVNFSGPGQKVGYVIRNGWTLFEKNEVLEDAAIAVDTTTTTTTSTTSTAATTIAATMTLSHQNHTQVGNIVKLPMNEAPSHEIGILGDDNGYCRQANTFIDHRLIGGMKSGVFTEHGTVNDFPSCVKYCCHDRSCDLAYQVGLTCYSIKCFNIESCRTFSVPKFFLNPVIAFVSRDPNAINQNTLNNTAAAGKHPYNVMRTDKNELDDGNTKSSLFSTRPKIIPQTSDEDVYPKKPKENHTKIHSVLEWPNSNDYKDMKISPNDNDDLGSKRHKQAKHGQNNTNSRGKQKQKQKHQRPEKNKKEGNSQDKTSHHDWTRYNKNKKAKKVSTHTKDSLGEKRHKQTDVDETARKKSKTNDISNIFNNLLGGDKSLGSEASGSGDVPLDVTSGSGLEDRLEEIELNLVHALKANHRLKETDGKGRHVVISKKGKDHHHQQKKKNKQKKKTKKKQTTKHSKKHKTTSSGGHHSAMSDVDMELIQALSPNTEYNDCDAAKYDCEHYCIPLFHGGIRCLCKQGYRLALDGKHCLYEGACDARAHSCNQKCKYTNNGYRCTCRSGFVMQKDRNDTCQDMDECSMGINGCSDVCINTQGSYICECSNGYVLGADRMTCDIVGSISRKNEIVHPEDERFAIPAMIISSPNYTVINQSHNMLLQCRSFGFPTPAMVWTHGENSNHRIQADTRFTFLPGGFMLLQSAYVNDSGRYSCISSNIAGSDTARVDVQVNDIDECANGDNNCEQACFNTNGSYKCDCYFGYQLAHDRSRCQDVNECNSLNNCQQYCWNTPGSYYCGCKDGYLISEDNRHCQDIDECMQSDISRCSQICNNTIGGYECACTHGYILTTDNKTCQESTDRASNMNHASMHRHKLSKPSSYVFVTVCITITVAVISGTLWYLIRNYKKRWKNPYEEINLYTPPDGFLRTEN